MDGTFVTPRAYSVVNAGVWTDRRTNGRTNGRTVGHCSYSYRTIIHLNEGLVFNKTNSTARAVQVKANVQEQLSDNLLFRQKS